MIPVGTMVTLEAPGSRATDGEVRRIPAVVLQQWPDQSLELYAFHFEGVPSLVRSVPLDRVQVVQPATKSIDKEPLKFSIAANDPR